MIEVRWHGRGGQGAKTAALLLADAALGDGKYVQAFPEYGPERMGAPVQSFNRISTEPISLHSGVTSPQIVVILDPTLIEVVDVTQGIKEDGVVLINTAESPQSMRPKLNIQGRKIYTVDASRISQEEIGREIPNTPMLGALVKVTGVIDSKNFLADTRVKLEKKFKSKPEVVEGNIRAIRRAFQEVKSE